ncbi:MAG: hypothetical protein PHP01_06570 [Phycisphaerae bacterium]|nr:hypothetical protein [Phycisphaerae bacterium]
MGFRKFYIALFCAILLLGFFAEGVSSCTAPLASDLNDDCKVDFRDFAIMASLFDYMGEIYLRDLANLAEEWLNCTMEDQADCWK